MVSLLELGLVKHFFQNPYDDLRKIFVLSNTPHLFKCILRWRHYQVLYEKERKLPGNTNVCPKFIESHIGPCSFAKMRVSLMTQCISNQSNDYFVLVHVGLNIYRQRLTEELEDSEPTAMFSLYLNNLFDCFNRRYPGEGIKHSSPDIDKVPIILIDSWEMEVSKNMILPDNYLTKETAEGLRVTLQSMFAFIEYLYTVGFDFVLTSKANQDKIEVSD
ncbi:Uncharacterized protein FWK35_00031513, partial [Aphis craccivora]